MNDDDLRQEIESHLAMRTEHNQREGMKPEEAREAARRQFGNATQVQEQMRAMHIPTFIDALAQDLRYALRGLRRNPAFALTAICAVALGIGSTTAIFSVVDRLLFRPLPYPAEERLVSFGLLAPVIDSREFLFGSLYLPMRDWPDSPFEALASLAPGSVACDLTDERPVRLNCAMAERTLLPTFGVIPLLGRNFTPEEDQPNAPKAALLSYGLWQSRFGADPNVLEHTLSLDGMPVRIIGVLPRGFELPTLAAADLLLPQQLNEARQRPPNSGALLRVFARLKPGLTPRQAEARLEATVLPAVLKTAPAPYRKELRIVTRSVRERMLQDAHAVSWVLFGAVLAVLLTACANVSDLLLARAASRQRELAMRMALGAGRGRLIRQTLTESLVLASAGGLAGWALAASLLRLFVAIAPDGILRLTQATLDWRVFAFTLAATAASGILFGLAPALDTPSPQTLAGWRAGGASRRWFRQMLVSAQIAVSVTLLTAALLLLQSLWKLQNVPLGIEQDHLLTVTLTLGAARYGDPAQQLAFLDDLETRLKSLPGVTAVAVADSLPPGDGTRAQPFFGIRVEGREPFTEGTGGMVAWRAVTPAYFEALRIPMLEGHTFSDADRKSPEEPVILSRTLANLLFPRENPIGKHLKRFPESPIWATVVGVAADVKNAGLAAKDSPEYYVVRRHFGPEDRRTSRFLLRASTDPRALTEWVRSQVAAIDPSQAVQIETMRQRVGNLAERPRFNALLFTLFGGMGVLLAAIGIYGVISFLVAGRTQEIGLRMALGASEGKVVKLVLIEALRSIVWGAAAGSVGWLAAAGWLKSMLFEVPERDPRMLFAALCILCGVALLAAWTPSRRAARINPVVALRQE